MRYTNRADLLIAAGESIKMQEKFGVTVPVCKFCGNQGLLFGRSFDDPRDYEFPIAVVEGKPVFVGDELWNVPNNFKFVVRGSDMLCEKLRILGENSTCAWICDASWTPPKPKTVMVELLREDADGYANWRMGTARDIRFYESIRKALEN
jgi:hypothetical protein